MIQNGSAAPLKLDGWSLKTEKNFIFSFPSDWEIKTGESLRVQTLNPANRIENKEEETKGEEGDQKHRTPILEREGDKLSTVWDEPGVELWDWDRNTVIGLVNPQGTQVTQVTLPTNLTPGANDGGVIKQTAGEEREEGETPGAEKTRQSCLVM